jgi:hypothetical protein
MAVLEDCTYTCVQQINKGKQMRVSVKEMHTALLGVKKQEVRSERKNDTVNGLKFVFLNKSYFSYQIK